MSIEILNATTTDCANITCTTPPLQLSNATTKECQKTICPIENLYPSLGKQNSDCLTNEDLGRVRGCSSDCRLYNTSETCCTDAYNTSDTCSASSKFLKEMCKDAYSWAYDDPSSNKLCRPGRYASMNITFCPT